jgi:endonuclease/exonuclease/phosphatase family metal-dependent hydrolase
MLNFLTFNCQYGKQPGFGPFMKEVLSNRTYDFLMLQEVGEDVLKILNPLMKEHKYNRVYVSSPVTDQLLKSSILYKQEFEFLRSDFITFSPIVFQQLTETGCIAALFRPPRKVAKYIGKKHILVIVTHLHASYHLIARKKEILQIKRQARYFGPKKNYMTVIGGDFNNLVPGEYMYNNMVMQPHYVNVTNFEEWTYDSTLIEDKFKNFFLAKPFFKMKGRWNLKLDYIYVDKETSKKLRYQSNVIDVVASDHKPVEVRFVK